MKSIDQYHTQRNEFGVYLGVKYCDVFSLFLYLVLGFGLMVSWLFCLLRSTSSVSLTGFKYSEDEPDFVRKASLKASK